jgi:hypothetical protein
MPTQESKQPVTYDHLKSRKKPVQKFVWIALDPELADEEADQKQLVDRLRIRHIARPDDTSVTKELADAEQKLEGLTATLRKPDNSTKFVFRSIGRRRYDDLIGEHQPTEEQIAELKRDEPDATLEFNPATFPPAIVAACIVEPALTKSEINDMWDSEAWNAVELSSLFEACLLANNTRRLLDLGNASRGANSSAKS